MFLPLMHITNYIAPYKLGNTSLEWVEETKYLGFTIQTTFKFDTHMEHKTVQASKVLGMVNWLYDAPRQGRLLVYTSLCCSILEYADAVWDPSLKKTMHDIKMVQNHAVKFISKLKGRVSEDRWELGLQTLQERHKNHRLTLLTRIFQAEDMHSALSSAYEELVDDHIVAIATRSAARGVLTSISTNSRYYHQSFLPRTIREMRSLMSNN